MKILGIKNCDTMKRAFQWLDSHGLCYEFHDYKKDNIDLDIFNAALEKHGWKVILNQRGTTWRKLADEIWMMNKPLL